MEAGVVVEKGSSQQCSRGAVVELVVQAWQLQTVSGCEYECGWLLVSLSLSL